jgi:multiple sugar transport system substrate-binding protein
MLRGTAVAASLTMLIGCGGDTAANANKQSNFAGAALRFSIEKGSPLAEALRLRIPEWEARTGAKVTVTEDDVVDPAADLAACSGTALAALPGRRAVSSDMKRDPEIGFVHIPYLHQTAFGARAGQTVAIPLAAEIFLLWRRADLFADGKLKAAFQKEFNAPLDPPKTWDDYVRIAAFFQKSKAVKFGCVEAFGPDADGLRGYFARAAAFSEDPRAVPLDVDDGRPRLGDADFLKAAENLLVTLPHSPAAGGKAVTIQQAREIFAAGDAAMILVAAPPTSHPSIKSDAKFADKLAVSSLPSSPEVFGLKTKSWRPRMERNREVPEAPFLARTGHFVSVSKNSNNAAATESLLAFLTSTKDNAYIVQGARLGLTPSREELLNDSGRFAGGYGLPGKLTSEYFSLVRESLRPSRWATDLRVAKPDAFLQSLGDQLQNAAAGKVSVADALKNADRQWSAEISKRGDAFVEEFRMGQGFSPRIK